MRYRIKIITYSNGRRGYTPYVKKRFWWSSIAMDGSEGYGIEWKERATAMNCIDNHFNGNKTVQTIEFEYLNKP